MSERILYEFLAGGKFFHRPTNGKSPWRPSLPDGLTMEDLAIIQNKLADKRITYPSRL